VATLIWGASFVITRTAVQAVPPLAFVSLRFLIAAGAVAIFSRPPAGRLQAFELCAGVRIGVAMLGGYTLQALAMSRGLDSGRAAFISSLYVPIVPLLQLFLLRRAPAPKTWFCLALAACGLSLMSGLGAGGGQTVPQLLVLLGACSIAVEIMLVASFAGRIDPRRLAIIECVTLGTLAGLGALLSDAAWPALHIRWVLAAAGLGLASACLQIAVNWAQPEVGPSRATLIYTMEPVWAALFGNLAGEKMKGASIIGAILILASVLVSATGRDAPPPHPGPPVLP
jgi:drug/metabolite transporter (DMT)-like permease